MSKIQLKELNDYNQTKKVIDDLNKKIMLLKDSDGKKASSVAGDFINFLKYVKNC
jgi:hypothetical protein